MLSAPEGGWSVALGPDWDDVSAAVQDAYERNATEDSLDVLGLKRQVHALFVANQRGLLRALEFEARSWVGKCRWTLLQMLRTGSQPPRDFVAAVVTAYQDTVDAATIQTQFLDQVEKVAHLKTAGVTWALLNKYLFLQLVFQDSEILDGTSRLISLTKYERDEADPEDSTLSRYKEFHQAIESIRLSFFSHGTGGDTPYRSEADLFAAEDREHRLGAGGGETAAAGMMEVEVEAGKDFQKRGGGLTAGGGSHLSGMLNDPPGDAGVDVDAAAVVAMETYDRAHAQLAGAPHDPSTCGHVHLPDGHSHGRDGGHDYHNGGGHDHPDPDDHDHNHGNHHSPHHDPHACHEQHADQPNEHHHNHQHQHQHQDECDGPLPHNRYDYDENLQQNVEHGYHNHNHHSSGHGHSHGGHHEHDHEHDHDSAEDPDYHHHYHPEEEKEHGLVRRQLPPPVRDTNSTFPLTPDGGYPLDTEHCGCSACTSMNGGRVAANGCDCPKCLSKYGCRCCYCEMLGRGKAAANHNATAAREKLRLKLTNKKKDRQVLKTAVAKDDGRTVEDLLSFIEGGKKKSKANGGGKEGGGKGGSEMAASTDTGGTGKEAKSKKAAKRERQQKKKLEEKQRQDADAAAAVVVGKTRVVSTATAASSAKKKAKQNQPKPASPTTLESSAQLPPPPSAEPAKGDIRAPASVDGDTGGVGLLSGGMSLLSEALSSSGNGRLLSTNSGEYEHLEDEDEDFAAELEMFKSFMSQPVARPAVRQKVAINMGALKKSVGGGVGNGS
jgi:hypothetical protein